MKIRIIPPSMDSIMSNYISDGKPTCFGVMNGMNLNVSMTTTNNGTDVELVSNEPLTSKQVAKLQVHFTEMEQEMAKHGYDVEVSLAYPAM